MLVNPKQFSWDGATTRVDGSTYDITDRKGYDLAIKPVGATDVEFVEILGVISTNQSFVAQISELANPINKGTWTAGVREVDNNNIKSEWASLDFIVEVAPNAPTNFIVS